MTRTHRPWIHCLALFTAAGCTADHVMEQVTSTPIRADVGGVAHSHDGLLRLEFEPGALSEDTDIRIETRAGLADDRLVGHAYELGPDGLTFSGAVELSLNVAGVDEELEIVNLDGEAPVPVTGSVHDLAAGIVRAPLAHFSSYGAMRRPAPCAGLSCGDPCARCPPQAPNCQGSGNPYACNSTGACVPRTAVMCGAPDAGTPPPIDAGQPADAGAIVDAGPPADGGVPGLFEEVERNDTLAQANVPPLVGGMQPRVTIHGALPSPNDVDTFEITVPAGGARLSALTYDVWNQAPTCNQADTILYLRDAMGLEIVRNDDGGDRFCSRLDQVLPAGTYYVQVQSFAPGGVADYFLDITLSLGVAPDAGVPVDAGQPADAGAPPPDAGAPADAGSTGGIVLEVEPNDTLGTSQALSPRPMQITTVSASIGAPGDLDVFALQHAVPGGTVRARTYGVLGQPMNCGGIDTILTAYDAAGNQVARNDDISSMNWCSEVVVPATGGLYFEVSTFAGTIPQYYLDIELQ